MLAGCSSLPTPEEALEDGPLPYEVGVYLEWVKKPAPAPQPPGTTPDARPSGEPQAPAEGVALASSPSPGALGNGGPGDAPETPANPSAAPPAGNPPKEPPPPKIRFTSTHPELADALESAISRRGEGTFSRTRLIRAASREEALRAAKTVDALVALRFQTPDEYTDRAPSAGWTTLEVVCWLLGGVPAWFVPSIKFFTEGRLAVDVIDMHQPAVRAWLEAPASSADGALPRAQWSDRLEAPTENVSLWDRSHPFHRPLDYLLTIFVPPVVFTPGDRERVSQELTSDVTNDLASDLASRLRARFLEAEPNRPVSIVFLSPDPNDTMAADNKSVRVTVAIASRGAGKITAMDVHRLAGDAPRFRHKLSSAELKAFLAQMAAAQGGYVTFELPVEIPLAPGENRIKVRVLRDDEVLVTRTMTYVREE
jgi:hypothetical protein